MQYLASRSASRQKFINCQILKFKFKFTLTHWKTMIIPDNNSIIIIRLGVERSYEMFSIAVSKPPSIHQLSSGLPTSSSSSYCCIAISSQSWKLWNYDANSIFIIIRLGVREVFSIEASLSIRQKVVCGLQASAVNPISSSTSTSRWTWTSSCSYSVTIKIRSQSRTKLDLGTG